MTTAAKQMPFSQSELSDLFSYSDGRLFWKVKPCKHMKAGSEAGSLNKNGYKYVSIKGSKQLLHRVIFKMHTGLEPSHVDHIDRNPANNTIENLRASTFAENAWNMNTPKTNTSGVMGVHWDKRREKWMAYMRHNGKRKHLGYYSEFDAAVSARKSAEIMRQVDAGTLVIAEAE